MQMQDLVGQQLGHYYLIRLIGSGGYAEVYLAEHIHLNLQCALKVLTGTNLKAYQREEFLAEARTIANLQRLSTHIVQISDFGIQVSEDGTNSGIPYFVMEYAAEGTLRSLYPPGTQVPLDRITFYVNQVAEALQCAHSQNPPIVHRDIKPENMLLRSLDHILLSDFGIALSGKTGLQTQSTEGIIGTAAYLAPERFSHITRRASDQYALAIVVYEWLSGSLPFKGTDREICYQQLKDPPPPLCPNYPHVTQEMEAVVMHALAKKPEDRYPTVSAFAQALKDAIQVALQQKPLTGNPTLGGTEKTQQRQLPSMGKIGDQPTKQLHLPNDTNPHQIFIDTTDPFTQQGKLSPAMPAFQSTKQPMQKIRDFFDFAPQFASTQRFSFFRTSGFILNILSAVIVGLLLQNGYAFLGGVIFSFLMFRLCILAVEEKLALFFGTMVALYWAWVGWVGSNFITSSLHFSELLTIITCPIFFISSLGLHIWYVSRKNW